MPAAAPARQQSWLVLVALIVVTFAAYLPAWHGGLLWDDDAHLIPPALASASGLARIWTRLKSYWTLWPYSY